MSAEKRPSRFDFQNFSFGNLMQQQEAPSGASGFDDFKTQMESLQLNQSRDSACVFPNNSFNQSDTSLPNQTYESGIGCESFEAFNQFPSINNVSYDGCFFDDENPNLVSHGFKDVKRSSILSTAVAHGGMSIQSSIKLENEIARAYALVKRAKKLRQSWYLIGRISQLRCALTGQQFRPETLLDWTVPNLFQNFLKEFLMIKQTMGPKVNAILIPLAKMLELIRPHLFHEDENILLAFFRVIHALHWSLSVEVATKKLQLMNCDQYRIDKAYELWNKCS